jgi:ATP-dependent Clp protease ATP-binding subunit ClpA
VRPQSMSIANTSRKTRAWKRRFQPVLVNEPPVEDTIAIPARFKRALRSTSTAYGSPDGAIVRSSGAIAALTSRSLSARIRRSTWSKKQRRV